MHIVRLPISLPNRNGKTIKAIEASTSQTSIMVIDRLFINILSFLYIFTTACSNLDMKQLNEKKIVDGEMP